jgi:hypothetical protein
VQRVLLVIEIEDDVPLRVLPLVDCPDPEALAGRLIEVVPVDRGQRNQIMLRRSLLDPAAKDLYLAECYDARAAESYAGTFRRGLALVIEAVLRGRTSG